VHIPHLIWVTFRLALYLYRFAGTWPERFSLSYFLLQFFLAHCVPKRFHPGDTLLRVQGMTYVMDPGSTEIFTLGELYGDRHYDRLGDFTPKPGWTVVDVGANVGMFTFQQARRGARVYAFEPNPDCYRRLLHGVVKNRWTSSILVFNAAVGLRAGLGMIACQAQQTTAGVVVPVEQANVGRDLAVTITSLDLMFPSLMVTHVDLLKIDVEGAEIEVLQGARHVLALVDRIVLEYHSPDLLQQACTLLGGYGFTSLMHVDTGATGILYAKKSLE